jgi:PKD domain-containing protein
MGLFPASRIARRLFIVTAVAASALVGVAGTSAAGADSGASVAVPVESCPAATPGFAQCFAMHLVQQRLSQLSPAARAAALHAQSVRQAVPAALDTGPAGGYTPADLAKAYGLDVTASAAASITVALVDAYDAPNIKADLNAFNAHYGIAAETATSFRVVNQSGAASPLPAFNSGWAGESTLDVQTVRGLCRKCKIVLVEADSNSYPDLAAAENTAAGSLVKATIISNSFGGVELPDKGATNAAAYNHPGVAIVASTGDDGWYGFDKAFDGGSSANAANIPASLNTVVAVGGTSLYLNPTGTRASETVWNENGPFGRFANLSHRSLGASGGGCSQLYSAQLWQRSVSGYASLGCGATLRSTGDIAAIADPYTGYDIYSSSLFGGWATFGGTSLAAPAIAAMWALAGGPGGIKYPALSLYGHYKSSKATYDVTVGGNGLCQTASTTSCSSYWSGNPNTLGSGLLDCAFAATGTATVANRAQCDAQPGYDGPSGVGTPVGVTTFKPMKPVASIASPGTVKHGVTKRFDGSHSSDPFPGGTITKYTWKFGDGGTGTGAKPTHKYAKKGKTYTITLTVTDSYGLAGTTTRKITTT